MSMNPSAQLRYVNGSLKDFSGHNALQKAWHEFMLDSDCEKVSWTDIHGKRITVHREDSTFHSSNLLLNSPKHFIVQVGFVEDIIIHAKSEINKEYIRLDKAAGMPTEALEEIEARRNANKYDTILDENEDDIQTRRAANSGGIKNG